MRRVLSPSVPPLYSAAASSQGGCRSIVWLPPLSVIVVGLFLACLLLQASSGASILNTAAMEVPDAGTSQSEAALAAFFAPEVRFWADWIQRWAEQTHLPPNLIATVMQVESCGDPLARSPAGAMGLFQVMPYHFAVGEDPYDPETNARRGLAYLQRAVQASSGDIRLAFAAYNGGFGVIGREEFLWPAETQRYVYWAGGIYSDALSARQESPRLQEWLLAGGINLCRQARKRLGLGGE